MIGHVLGRTPKGHERVAHEFVDRSLFALDAFGQEGEVLVQDAQEKIAIIPTVSDVRVDLVFDPPWNREMMTEAARLETGML